jgi:transcriptional regulator with XRE-family HTH domain
VLSRSVIRGNCVTHYTDGAQHVTQGGCNHFQMAKTPKTPAHRYAENLRILLKLHEMTVADVALAAGVVPKQVYNFLNVSHDPRIKGLEKVANVFGLTTWQMLAIDMTTSPAENRRVLALLERFSAADEGGQAAILQVAEMAASKALKSA